MLNISRDASFDPGGWLDAPPISDVPLLNLQAYSRMNIYLADENEATLIIDAEITQDAGVPYCQLRPHSKPLSLAPWIWLVEITSKDRDGKIDAQAYITPNSTANEIYLPIKQLRARYEPYEIEITLENPDCRPNYMIKTQIYRLPLRKDGGSVVRLDRLHGGLQAKAGRKWRKIFPFGFYADWGGYLRHVHNQEEYAALGYNVVSPVPAGGDTPFEQDSFASYVVNLDAEAPSIMYNMRWTYKNDALITAQVNQLQKHRSILLWYTADEPGGQGDPLDAPLKAYDMIKKRDAYHPVALVLNCANFHYAEYTRGADIILTDPYPIAVNTSWSSRWNTECTTTYGCCGCDNCHGNFRDVSDRLDNFKQYQRWLSNAPLGKMALDPGRAAGGPKSFWGVPQVFGGSEYWARPPTAEEEIVIIWLFINHGAKGIMGWLFPTTPALTAVMSHMARVVTSEEVTNLLLGDNPRKASIYLGENVDIDSAVWIAGHSMLLSVAYLGSEDTSEHVAIRLPAWVKAGSACQLWPPIKHQALDTPKSRDGEELFEPRGTETTLSMPHQQTMWRIDGSKASAAGLPATSVFIFVMDLDD